MREVRIGIIGFGGVAREHARYIFGGEISEATLAAVCDINPNCLEIAKNLCSEKVKFFNNSEELFKSGLVDAVIIATPHYQHSPLAIAALKHNLHVLIEKPAGVYTRQVYEMNEFAGKSDRVLAIMFNWRCRPIYKKLKGIVDAGELGDMKRTNWIITDWYRPQSYYDAGQWRATWSGEGGGVLLNQCPHQLDLWQWICGMPQRVRAFCGFGKYHNIEVEDDVTAYVEYENGATGIFIASTGETPGSNRFEVMGDKGKIVVENGEITFWRNRISERDFNRQFKGGFGMPECCRCQIPIDEVDEGHKGITRNWVQAILHSVPLIAPGQEGINSLEISNAMLLSSWQDDWVKLPIEGELFYSKLQEKIKKSKHHKKTSQSQIMDVTGTF
jgi:predicted dehydrogenase